jgi:hypothetical protein
MNIGIILLFEPVIFQVYMFYQSFILPMWYYFLCVMIPDKTDYFIVILQNNTCRQYALTPDNYRDISLTPFLGEYFLLVSHISYTSHGVDKRHRVVNKNKFRITPMQSWLESRDQVNILEERYKIDSATPIQKILLGGQCEYMNRKLTIELDSFCIPGNVLFTQVFNAWLWEISLRQSPINAKKNIQITIIDTDINEITLEPNEYIEISTGAYKKLRKTI